MEKTIYQEIFFNASPHDVYEALMDSEKHAQFTNTKARISRVSGGSFSAYDGYISGYIVKLVQDEKIIQFWKAHSDDWPQEHLSRVEYIFTKKRKGTLLKFTHSGVPEKVRESISTGWNEQFWKPLKKMLEN